MSKPKLYKMNVNYEMVVLSSDGGRPGRLDLEDWAENVLGDRFHRTNLDPKITLKAIKTVKELPRDWKNSIPFGDDTSITCKKILEGAELPMSAKDVLENLTKHGHISEEELKVLTMAMEK